MDVPWLVEIMIPDDDDEDCQAEEEAKDDDNAGQDDGDDVILKIDNIFHQGATDEDCWLLNSSQTRPSLMLVGIFL